MRRWSQLAFSRVSASPVVSDAGMVGTGDFELEKK